MLISCEFYEMCSDKRVDNKYVEIGSPMKSVNMKYIYLA